jgi:protein-tyrosine phosphatase
MDGTEHTSILFVCMGNICRSPTAQGVVETLLAREGLLPRVRLDSAGTHDYHVGAPPDPRTQAAARERGYDLSAQRARRVAAEDFHRFDLILAMDRANLRALQQMAPRDGTAAVHLFLEYLISEPGGPDEVPDSFYGDGLGFERVLDLVEAAGQGLIARLRTNR